MRHLTLPRLAALAALGAVLALSPSARADAYGLLRAYVADEEGRPVANAAVKIGPPGLPGFTATSDASGLVQIRIKARTYGVAASRKGFEADALSGVEVPPGGVKDVALILRPSGPATGPAGVPAAP